MRNLIKWAKNNNVEYIKSGDKITLLLGNVYTVEDLGTPYGHVDIYCSSHSEALSFGLQYADVYQLN